VRYGNGVCTWNNFQDLIVRRNHIWECYDAGITPQGTGASHQEIRATIVYNRIWNCEYGFEWWAEPESSVVDAIIVAHNVFYNNGGGVLHAQRPDGAAGRGICIQGATSTSVTNCILKNNIVHTSQEHNLQVATLGAIDGWVMDYNIYYPEWATSVGTWANEYSFAGWQAYSGQEAHSLTVNPLFVNAAGHDFRLRQDSPCRDRGIAVAGFGQIVEGGQPDIGYDEVLTPGRARRYRR
jgi:hypothetical protein